MLFRPSIDLLVDKTGNKYVLCATASDRARDLQKKVPTMLEGNSNNAIKLALEEIAEGKVVASNK